MKKMRKWKRQKKRGETMRWIKEETGEKRKGENRRNKKKEKRRKIRHKKRG